MEETRFETHPEGEKHLTDNAQLNNKILVDTYGGRVHVEWDDEAPVTQMGQLVFFIEFLKRTELFDHWVSSCPLKMSSNNAPQVRDILGTILLSILSGHKHYAHITAIRTDKVNAPLLGMKKIVSEDSVRRAMLKLADLDSASWLSDELKHAYGPALFIPWILDVDTTVKCLYGHQEGAEVGYNPSKPGRPSHTYHTYMIGAIRMILDVEVMAGNESSSSQTLPHLFSWLDKLPKAQWPSFLRGDCGFGTDLVMNACEARALNYLFKLKQTPNVKRLIAEKMCNEEWCRAGQGWQGCEGELKLMGWTSKRKVIVLRRKLKKDIGVLGKNKLTGQMVFEFAEPNKNISAYEYAVLVTNMEADIFTLANHYRDRADCENNFDELKNQWGWSGYTTKDLERCRLMAKMIALVYNWWTLFVRLVSPDQHLEAVTSRPLLLNAVGKQTKHAGHKRLHISSSHGKFKKVQYAFIYLSDFFKTLKPCAEQLSWQEKLKRIIYRAFKKFLGELPHGPPNLLLSPT